MKCIQCHFMSILGLVIASGIGHSYCRLLGSLPVVCSLCIRGFGVGCYRCASFLNVSWSISSVYLRVQSSFTQQVCFARQTSYLGCFYSFFSLTCMIPVKKKITSHMQLDFLWDWGWTFPSTGTRKSADSNGWVVKKEEWTGAGRVKRLVLKLIPSWSLFVLSVAL